MPFFASLGLAEWLLQRVGEEGLFCHHRIVTGEHTIAIQKHTYGLGFKKHALWALKEIWEFFIENMGTPHLWSLHTNRCAHCDKGQQSCLSQRNEECPIS